MFYPRMILTFCLSLLLLLTQGCTILCRSNCPSVEHIRRPCPAPCGIFPRPCPAVNFPGFYATDYNCLEKLQRLTALRARGIGVIILGDRLRIILPTDSFFKKRDHLESINQEINDCHVKTLADIAEVLKCIPCVPICVSGHTDDIGTRADRFAISRAFAQTVAAHLWAQGIPWDRLRVVGRGDCDPIASDASVFGSTDNRRVEIRLDFSRNYLCGFRYNNCYCPDGMTR